MHRILLALVGLVLTLAPTVARSGSIGERSRQVGVVVVEGLGDHARVPVPIGAAAADAGLSAREGTGPADPSVQSRREAPHARARSSCRASIFGRGFGEAARGDHLPYFPVAPPVLG